MYILQELISGWVTGAQVYWQLEGTDHQTGDKQETHGSMYSI